MSFLYDSENAMSKVDSSDLGPTEAAQEGVSPEHGVDEEHKIIEGAGEQPAGSTRENELNLG